MLIYLYRQFSIHLLRTFLFALNYTSLHSLGLTQFSGSSAAWGCDHNIGRCKIPEFTIKPAVPKAKLIYFILSAQKPRSASVALLYRCLIWDSGRCILDCLSYIDSEDLEVCDIIMRIDLLVLWPGESRRDSRPHFQGARALWYHGKIGSMLFAWLTSWCAHNPPIIRPCARFTILHQRVYLQPFLSEIRLENKNGSPVLVVMNWIWIWIYLIVKIHVPTFLMDYGLHKIRFTDIPQHWTLFVFL